VEGFPGELGIQEHEAEAGHSRLTFDAEPRHLNAAGTLHGGILATLLDSAMGVAARSSRGERETPATSQLSIAFLRPGKPGQLLATAAVRKQGDHVLLCEAEVEQDDKTLAHAVATFAVLEP
jgi:uncharacterized protein (TIGR00369 family)